MTDFVFFIPGNQFFLPNKARLLWVILISCAYVIITPVNSYSQNDLKTQHDVIVVGGNYDYPPYEFIDANGNPSGYSTELTYALAEVMGINVHVQLNSWKKTRERLETGKIDAIHGMYYSVERDKLVDFSPPHTIIYNTIFSRKNVQDIKSLKDLKNKKIVIVEKGALHDFLNRNEITDNIVVADSDGAALRLISSGDFDYALLGKLPGIYLSKKLNLTNLKPIGPPLLPFEYCYAVKEGNLSLLSRLNEGLAILKETGQYDKIYDKWLGVYESKERLQNPIVRKLLMVLVCGSVILAIVGLWLGILKKQVAVRTNELRREVEERRQAQEALQESESRYRLLTENTYDVVFQTKIPEATYDYVSPSVLGVFGYPPAAFYEDPLLLLKLLPEGWDTYFHDKWAEIHDGKRPKTYEFPVIDKNSGKQKWMAQSNVWIEDERNNLVALQGRVTDITNQKINQEALIQSENRLRTIIDTIPDLVWQKDCNGIYISCNAAFERFFGAKEIEIVGKTDYDFVDRDLADFFRANDRKAMAANRASINEEELTFAHDGYNGLFETIKTPMRDAEGILIGVLGIARDISERQRASEEKLSLEKKLRQSQKMESIGNLAGGIAHDFNNILSSVIGFTELALDDVEKDSMIEDNLQEVYTAGKRAKELVGHILAFARQSEEKVMPIQVDEIIEEVLQFIRSSIPTSIEVKKNINSNSLIMGNKTQLHQIMMNLCTNAAHAMEDEGGVLEIGLKDIEVDRNFGKRLDLTNVNYIEITVTDTGTGIPSHIIDSIFEPYFTTKDPGEGTGMGLAMVHGIVETYRGKILVDSNFGKGTTFTIYLPIARKRKIQRQYEPGQLPIGTERILFVDDETPITKMVERKLEGLGYSVTTRTSSVEALELFRTKQNDFDLVISDMTMPNMTGDKLAIELIKIRPDIPVILCTGYSKKISDKTASNIGIKAFAYKPIVKTDLAKIVRKVLDEAKGENQQ